MNLKQRCYMNKSVYSIC